MRPLTRRTIAAIGAALVAVFLQSTSGDVSAQPICAPTATDLTPAVYGIYLPGAAGEADKFKGTAFVIDPRGILMTARHLTRDLPVGGSDGAYVKTADANAPKLQIEEILKNGRFGFSYNGGDDWSIFTVNMMRSNGQPRAPLVSFEIAYDAVIKDRPDSLSVHSLDGGRGIEGQFDAFGEPQSIPCDENDAVRVTLDGYLTGDSGSPLHQQACIFGVTSQYSLRAVSEALREMLDLERLSQGVLDAFDRMEATGDPAASVELIQKIADEVTDSDADASIVRECLDDPTPTACARRFVDRTRELVESLEMVSVTPVSCVGETLLKDAITGASDLLAGASVKPAVVGDFDPTIQEEFIEDVNAIANNAGDWSFIAFFELLNVLRTFEEQFPGRAAERERLWRAVRKVALSNSFHVLLSDFADGRRAILEERLAELEAQAAAAETQLADAGANIEEIQNRRRALSQRFVAGVEIRDPAAILEMEQLTLAETRFETARESLLGVRNELQTQQQLLRSEADAYTGLTEALRAEEAVIERLYSEPSDVAERVRQLPFEEFERAVRGRSVDEAVQMLSETVVRPEPPIVIPVDPEIGAGGLVEPRIRPRLPFDPIGPELLEPRLRIPEGGVLVAPQ